LRQKKELAGENGKEEGVCGVRRIAAGRFRSGESVQGPGGDAGDEGVHREREVDPNREGQDHQRETTLVLPHRRRQPPSEVPPSRQPVPRIHSRYRLGQGRSPSLPPRSVTQFLKPFFSQIECSRVLFWELLENVETPLRISLFSTTEACDSFGDFH